MFRRINLSAAIIVLICFFLPWEQVSCGGTRDTLSGFELARHEHMLLWLIPLVMLAVLIFALLRRRAANTQMLAIMSLVAAGISALLMNNERARVGNAGGFISAQLTGWFWLGFIAVLMMILSAVGMFLRQPPPARE